jgi:tetratricopeptide (TPR) repeat protein
LAYFWRGRAYSAKGDKDRAIADHTKAIELDPNYVDAYYTPTH